MRNSITWIGLVIGLLLGRGVQAQSTKVAPDCVYPFSVTAAQAAGAGIRRPTLGFVNKVNGTALPCTTWALNFQAPVLVTALTVELDSAPDSAGVAGTWGVFAGTVVQNVANPTAVIPNDFMVRQGSPAWVSVKLSGSAGSGTITGAIYGWVVSPFSYGSASFTPAGTQDVNVIKVLGTSTDVNTGNASAGTMRVVLATNQPTLPVSGFLNPQPVGGQAASGAADAGNPVKVGGSNGTNDYNLKVDSQGNSYNFLGCTNTAEVALTGTGYVEIVAGTALQTIQICKIFVTSAAAGAPNVNTFSVASATITTCAGTTELYAAAGITGMDLDWGGALRSGAGKSICVSESVANGDKVTISYSKAAF